MKIDVEEILRKLEGKANTIYVNNDRLRNLLNETKNKVEKNKTLMEIWDDIKLLIDLIKDWMKGDYKEISKNSMIMIIISLIYLVSPIDLIPDFLIGGFFDDLAVIAYVIKKVSEELNIYKEWRKLGNIEEPIEVEVEFVADVVSDVIDIEDLEDIFQRDDDERY